MSFGLKLKQARNEAGLTQQELADKLGIAKSTIAGYENNSREPDVLKIKKITEILNVDADYLLGVEKLPHFSSTEKSIIEQYRSLDLYGKKAVNSILHIENERTKEQQQKEQSTNSNNIVEISKTENEEAPEIVFYESARDTYGTKDKYNTDLTPENIKKLKKLVEDAKDGELDDEYENS